VVRQKRHKRHEEEEHMDESWLIPYADLLTLLLALFIVLFAMRTEDKGKMDALMKSFYNAFNTVSVFDTDSGGQKPTDKTDSNPLPKPEEPEQNEQPEPNQNSEDEKNLQEFMKNMQKYIDDNGLSAEIRLTDLQEGIQITLKDTIIFDSGSDRLLANFTPTLDSIANMLKTIDNSIIVEGHTDDKPIHSSQFPSNWELSGSRALSVVHYLQMKDVNPIRLSYTGYGEFKPIYLNDTPEHREANRRVNFIVLRK
jgi:chemotaxis protein MotB